ncbi:MAG: type I-C CRISPR-associated protein Cas8c/Csd1 [Bifidobacterium scardovii]|uniref:type I-C CRISPR-associated protein Cas8c/Csd1 n=1 Tax=Bifidobacterium scardovii TaxID=158787 RepID=UPI002903A8B8|nr:type I-C CRISPR-associated protein Cas8c/Csd1 [Bifidobacterium scardovii]MDU2421003.1 type I-C CRISPR-associated protein Cas8c/Csd1 [Bifidobacterium scardovii]
MSLWSNLLQTYDAVQAATGISSAENDGAPDARKTLLPVYHTTMKTQLLVEIDYNAQLRGIEKDNKPFDIIIPCTEQSAGRSGRNPKPHPLCDQLQYVDSAYDVDKHREYMEQLDEWKGDNVKLNAIYRYLAEHSVIDDARAQGVDIQSEKDSKIGVRFSVMVPGGDHVPHTWQDPEIRDLWIAHQEHQGKRLGTDMLGAELYVPSSNFPKNIVSVNGNAKLISANDATNFTFRGRYVDRDEALIIDALASQKIHSTLKWLVGNNGTITGTQAIVIWAVDSKPIEHIVDCFGDSFDVDESLPDYDDRTDYDKLQEAYGQTEINYAERFGKLLRGYGGNPSLDWMRKHERRIAIAIFDAATTGRLSVTFYRELTENEYIENVLQWHKDSAWPLTRRNQAGIDALKNPDDARKAAVIPLSIRYIGTPSFVDIINCIYDDDERVSDRYVRFKKKVEKQLVECMFGNNSLPGSFLRQAFYRVIRPNGYDNAAAWRRDFEIACSMWKKHFVEEDRKCPEQERNPITMALDKERDDRDYLYGRLLALADGFEYRILMQQGRSGTVGRSTNAVRLMSNFAAKPYVTWKNIWTQLTPYINYAWNHAPGIAKSFQNDIDEVMSLFNDGDIENNDALSPLFLFGYSHQRKYLSDQANARKQARESNNNEGE